MKSDYPKIRNLDAFSVKDNLIYIRDPSGFSDNLLALSPPLFYVCTLCDGKHSLLELGQAFEEQFGQSLPAVNLEELIQKLDDCLFLDNETFLKAKDKIIKDFKQSSLRRYALAGSAYEADPKKLSTQLDSYFTHEKGPGALNDVSKRLDGSSGKLKGIIAPHIDLRRGGSTFAWSYSALANYSAAKLFIILGISHAPAAQPYILTKKNFETPLGIVNTDNDFLSRLTKKCNSDFFYDEYLHRNEHSIEFQTLFLRYLYPAHFDIKIVPILCSSFHASVQSKTSPFENSETKEFISALEETVSDYPEEICFIAGVDLSHIGQKFGQELTLSQAVIEKAEIDDRLMFDQILRLDAEGFFQFIQKEEDQRNVCGVSAIYTLLKVMSATKANLLKYDIAVEKETQSLVGFASAAFFE